MNDITLLREHGPAAPPPEPAALHAARAALLTEIERSTTVRGRVHRRLPSRRRSLQIGLALTTAAAAWTAAVVVGPESRPVPPPGGVTLVAFEPPTFPLSLDPVPVGLTPVFEGDGGLRVFYRGDHDQGFSISVSDEEPGLSDVIDVDEVSVGGREAEIVTTRSNYCDGALGSDDDGCRLRTFRQLVQERRDGQWVTLAGSGRYDEPDRLVEVAEALIDRPQSVPLQLHLAPAGWSLDFFKEGGRILTLVNDAYPEQSMTIHVPMPDEVGPADELLSQLMGPVGPIIPVTVNDRPAHLVRTDHGGGYEGWYLQAQFADGTTFVLQAPEAFTQDDLLAVAGQVTYTP